jgi:hypothetical protein
VSRGNLSGEMEIDRHGFCFCFARSEDCVEVLSIILDVCAEQVNRRANIGRNEGERVEIVAELRID